MNWQKQGADWKLLSRSATALLIGAVTAREEVKIEQAD